MPRASDAQRELERRRRISATMRGRMPKNIGMIAGWNKGKSAPWAAANLGEFARSGSKPWNKGLEGAQVSWSKGKKLPERSGANHPNWKGGRYASRKRWLEKNREKKNFWNLQRQARKLKAEGSHTLLEWELLKMQFGYKCLGCGEKKPLTQDHITPLSQGGSDYIWNIQPLCKGCNSSKGAKRIFYWVQKNSKTGFLVTKRS
jgi:5-methylcytosine-specific restriction endonuclease McrA